MKYYLEYLCDKDYDKKKIYDMIRHLLEMSNLPIEDMYELDFLTKCAQSDFTHYMYTKLGFYKKLDFDEKKARLKLCELLFYKEDKIRKVLEEWIEWWIVKWRQRVKITFENSQSEKNQQKAELQPAEDLLKKLKEKVASYYRRLSIAALVEVGEICSLDVISDYLLKNMTASLIGRYGRDRAYSILAFRPDLVKVEIVRKAVEIARMTQPIVILKVRVNVRNSESS